MKKFILFNSPIFWDATKEKEQYLSPLGLGYIATYLEKAGIDVLDISVDMEYEFEKQFNIKIDLMSRDINKIKTVQEMIDIFYERGNK